ncbi:TIGR00730 family Rossman fold protein [Aquabacterium sp. CECT 9606]|uniref:LOG family protein n=1 Tax=Aquabacterium sp. CECT 9606 TaxID=2845822 RepID=UPI001E531942|nr:TIGR00730 family Rossman fold protein [Aquabacterium sp. CECT 9606]CAH0350078.1 Putative cytokinin riboside 5'-monophosphate phosphoribohydrolase [Aquabacterium sp. CECT 9606]
MAAFSVCVYCGSRMGNDPAFEAAAREVGRQIGLRGWQLVYGGGSTGLMGAVADAALAHGASVIGVIPHRLVQRELGHPGLTELQVVDTMHERKHRMAMQSDAFLALPGGIGTMEEIFEIWTWRQLGYHQKPLGLLNAEGYYDDLLSFINRSRDGGFLWPDVQELLLLDTQADRLLDQLQADALRLLALTARENQEAKEAQTQTPPGTNKFGPGGVSPDI